MAVKQDAVASVHVLLECDVAGASLRDREPKQLRVDELKRWLKCRAEPQYLVENQTSLQGAYQLK